jgi:hypothetical protein
LAALSGKIAAMSGIVLVRTTVLLLLTWAVTVHAADSFETLSSIHDFAFGGIGAAGTTSKGEVAFRDIYNRPSAKDDFLKLLSSGNPQAKCYALVALRSLDPQTFSSKIETYKKDKTNVTTIGGCMIAVLPMSSVATNIEAGHYDSHIKKHE